MKTILIVEDEKMLCEIYEDSLKKDGYNVISILSGKGLIEFLKKDTAVDLIVLDIKLPDIPGTTLIQNLREKYPQVPIIMCSAYDTYKTDYELWSGKISDYIVKPVVLSELRAKIKKLLEKKEGVK